MLELKNITKTYQSGPEAVKVLKELNLIFRNSEFVSILGQSGCGKTTLLNIIGGLDHATTGDLIINNKSTKNFSARDWDTYRNHDIGFVFQSYNLIPHQTVLQNVELALSIGGVSKKERRQRAIEALRKVGLENHIKKHPNQLSGGQCQRVSIARALVNNPAIILADEPTGALDSDTSVQVMEILKEISRDRLVVMVTHNPDLAERYSTRIVRMLDGVIKEDTNPVTEEEYKALSKEQKPSTTVKKEKKSAMSYWTSMNLSLKNLLTKKRRTFITALACSIGIIGIAVILSVSTGMQAYVNSVQLSSASANYISISSTQSIFASLLPTQTDLPSYPSNATGIIPYTPTLNTRTQILSDEYLNYLNANITEDMTIATQYNRQTNLHFISKNGSNYETTSTSSTTTSLFSSYSWTEILDNADYVKEQYTTLYMGADGKDFPTEYNEIALVVDRYNRVDTELLTKLGITFTEGEEIKYSDIVDHEIRLALNNNYYIRTEKQDGTITYSAVSTTTELEQCYNNSEPLKIVCILRQNQNANASWIGTGIGYTAALTEYVMTQNATSDIVTAQKENPNIDILSGRPCQESTYNTNLIKLGASSTPSSIQIYPSSFDNKDEIIKILDNWNNTEVYKIYGNSQDSQGNYIADKYKVEYTDMSELLGTMLSDTINIITYALIAFSAISLIVSSIMIAIITYASVIERIKEIGVLRSLGARKRDVGRVFIAEAAIIGFVSAIIAIIATLIINLIINIVLGKLVGISTIASLNIVTAIAMIVLCIGLNVIASLAPAVMASKKDPVVALRSE